MSSKSAPAATAPRVGSGIIVTHTTCPIQGEQVGRIDVLHARTPEATVTVTWGGLSLRFLNAASAAAVLEGFAAARSVLMGVDSTAPEPPPVNDTVAVASLALTWSWPTTFAVVPRSGYSKRVRRTVHWVDLHMGTVTWQIMDRTGYHSAVSLLREAHRTAVAVCEDGWKWRADPTRDDYKRPR